MRGNKSPAYAVEPPKGREIEPQVIKMEFYCQSVKFLRQYELAVHQKRNYPLIN